MNKNANSKELKLPTLQDMPVNLDLSVGVAGVEGLHGPTKYNGLAESGAVLDPYIICKDLRGLPHR